MKGSTKRIIALLIGIVLAGSAGSYLGSKNAPSIGGDVGALNVLWKLSSGSLVPTLASWGIKVPSLASSGDCLVTDASGNITTDTCGGAGGSTLHVDGGGYVYPQSGDYHSAPKYVATSTTAASTFVNASTTQLSISGLSWFNGTTTWGADIHPIMHGIYALDSSGLHLHSSGGTEVAYFGAGGGANVTFPGYTSAILLTGSGGAVAEYTGTTCTNQFTRSLSALGVATCASVSPTDLGATDFGDFTCNGTTCSLDTSYQPLDSDLTAIAALANTDSNFIVGNGSTWVAESGSTVRTSLGLGSLATLSTITTSEITDDTITHADIADSDQATTMCIYIEDPTADDDLASIWANKTANDFLLTEIWAESDQTVAFDLQVDDGTPADVNGTDITPAAGEAEDTSLSGDTTVAAGEELDLVVTSVTNTPTWVSICWTGNWVD